MAASRWLRYAGARDGDSRLVDRICDPPLPDARDAGVPKMLRSLVSIVAVALLAGCAARGPETPRASWLLAGVDGPRSTASLVAYDGRVAQQFAQHKAERLASGQVGQIEQLIGAAPADSVVLVRFPTARGVRDWYKSDAYQQTIPLRADSGRHWLLGFEGPATPVPGPRPAFLVLRGELPAPTAAEAEAFKQYGGLVVTRLNEGDVDVLEGTPPKGGWMVVAFPSRGALAALWLDPEFRSLREGWDAAKSSAFLIDSAPR
jgi:uncharacterized protein (DUF1330 family)